MLKAKRKTFSFHFNFNSLKNPKVIGIVLFFVILGALPVALYEVQQQQTSQQHAAWVVSQTQTYYCNSALSVTLSLGGIGGNYSVAESPDCSTGFNKISSFQSSVIIKPTAGSVGAYAVHWMWAQFWCQDPNTSPCLYTGSDTGEHVVGMDASQGAPIVAQSNIKQAAPPYTGQACGVYQNDFGFYITDNSDPNKTHLCTTRIIAGQQVPIVLTQSGLGNRNNNAAWCNTGTVCTVQVNTPTPTPTHIPTPTPTITPTVVIPSDTPTVTPTDIPSDTPVPTASPSATPTETPPATPTVTPTGTLTPTLSPTETPTGNPTATPTVPPGSTPTPTIIVVQPTLPPTGPGSTFMTIGLVGVAISVLGMALLLGF